MPTLGQWSESGQKGSDIGGFAAKKGDHLRKPPEFVSVVSGTGVGETGRMSGDLDADETVLAH